MAPHLTPQKSTQQLSQGGNNAGNMGNNHIPTMPTMLSHHPSSHHPSHHHARTRGPSVSKLGGPQSFTPMGSGGMGMGMNRKPMGGMGHHGHGPSPLSSSALFQAQVDEHLAAVNAGGNTNQAGPMMAPGGGTFGSGIGAGGNNNLIGAQQPLTSTTTPTQSNFQLGGHQQGNINAQLPPKTPEKTTKQFSDMDDYGRKSIGGYQ